MFSGHAPLLSSSYRVSLLLTIANRRPDLPVLTELLGVFPAGVNYRSRGMVQGRGSVYIASNVCNKHQTHLPHLLFKGPAGQNKSKQIFQEVAMKSTMFVLAVAAVALVGGCQDIPTGPITANESIIHPSAKPFPTKHRLVLNGCPRQPYPWACLLFHISGYIDYTMVRLPRHENLFEVQFEPNAQLENQVFDQPAIDVIGNANFRVSVSEEGVAFYEARHLLPNRGDRLALFITFQITQGAMEVTDLALDYIE